MYSHLYGLIQRSANQNGADEPTGSLDKTNGKNIMDIFDKLKEKHKTIILVTHDEFISGYADRIVRIEDGEITEK